MSWTETIHSEVNREFVSNPYPSFGETVTIAVRCGSGSPVKAVYLHEVSQGVSRRTRMERVLRQSCRQWYQTELTVDNPRLQYSFEFETLDEGFYFYTQRGTSRIHQTEDHDFVIIADIDHPEWFAGAVFYQIFPDRFRSGDPGTGVSDGEYAFDGGITRVLPWGDEPPEYAEGRCLDFCNGDLAGIAEAIPYLVDLGVTALYLNPIFRARTNHRYDCIDYFHVDEHLGGDAALAGLVEALHAAGIRVMVDVSINHTGIDHPWFRKALAEPDSREAGFYYRNPAPSDLPEGGTGQASAESAAVAAAENRQSGYVCWFNIPTLPQLNFGSEHLREILWRGSSSMIRKWMRPPYGIDGWRFDVGPQVGRYRRDQFCHDIWREVRQVVKEENDQACIIGEHWEDHISYVLGDQWDGAMNFFGSGRLLRSWAGERDRFLNENWGHSPAAGRPLSAEELAEALRVRISRIPNQFAFRSFNLLDCHDTPRFHNNLEVFDWDIYRGMIMLLFLLPGAVSIYYGDEVGLSGHVHSIEGARFPMEWNVSARRTQFFELYRTLGRLKRSEPALAEGNWTILSAEGDRLVFARFLFDAGFVLLLNRSSVEETVLLPTTSLGVISAEDVFGDSDCGVSEGAVVCQVRPRESRLFRCRLEP